jgi:hypothetical protein
MFRGQKVTVYTGTFFFLNWIDMGIKKYVLGRRFDKSLRQNAQGKSYL